MKSFIFCVLILIFTHSKVCATRNTVDVFEFGDKDEGKVVFTKSDKIGLLEKNVNIPIVLPPCMELSYVRVDVDNVIGPPKVDLNEDISTVHIRYRRGQFSISSYTVTAKAVPSSACFTKRNV